MRVSFFRLANRRSSKTCAVCHFVLGLNQDYLFNKRHSPQCSD
jgi:hypothetical protein